MCNCGGVRRKAKTFSAPVPAEIPQQTQGTNQILVNQVQSQENVASSIQKAMIARRKYSPIR